MSVEGEKGEVDSEEMGEVSLPGIRGSVRSEADRERGHNRRYFLLTCF